MAFTPRLTRPEAGNKYYITKSSGGWSTAIKGSPTDKDCDVLHNCVGYAVGRFHEIAGNKTFSLFIPYNAENIFAECISKGLKTGKTPRLGALIVWQKGATLSSYDGAGHVAVVEEIKKDGTIVTSESGYNCKNAWWMTTRNNEDGNWNGGTGYTFLGFVYQPSDTLPDTDVFEPYIIPLKAGDLIYNVTDKTAEEISIITISSKYTIVEEKQLGGDKYGRLKSGAGWVLLDSAKDIKRGDKGDDVKWMQQRLSALGYLRASEVDGAYGNITFGALLAFQYDNKLTVNGVCDKAMRKLLSK